MQPLVVNHHSIRREAITVALALAFVWICQFAWLALTETFVGIQSPMTFLTGTLRLVKSKHNQNRDNHFVDSICLWNAAQHWVTISDVRKLATKLDSTEPCRSVWSAASSFCPGKSTVGEQAAYLIYGYKLGYFPPSLTSSACGSPEEIKELLDKEQVSYPNFETWSSVKRRKRGASEDISGTIFQARSWILPVEKPSNPKSEWIEKNGIERKEFKFDCLSGTPVRCVADGKVLYAGWYGGYGRLIIVNHGANIQTWYAHLKNKKFFVQVDENVHAGQQIGQVGQTGFSTEPHLHFEFRENGKPIVR